MHNAASHDYLAARVMTADPVTLVSCLFDGLIDTLRDARSALRAGDILGRSRALTRGIEILGELSVSLNQDAEMSAQLTRLYEYMIWKLTEANIQQAEAPVSEVERLAGEIAGAWRQLAMNGPNAAPESSPLHGAWALAPGAGPTAHVSLLG